MYKLRAPKDFEKPYEGTFLGYEVEPGECIDVVTDRERRFFKRLFFEDVGELPKRNDIKRLLVVMQGGLGDTLFATPGIKALKEQKPEVEITTCTWNIGSSAIKHNPYIDSRLYTVDTELSLHFSDFDEVIDFGRVINSRPEAEYTNAYDIYSEHFETLFDIQVEDKKPLYYLTDEEKIKARNVLIDNGVKATDKVVGLVDQSSNLTRSWPYPYTMELAYKLIDAGYKVVMLGKNSDLECKRYFTCPECGSNDSILIDTHNHIQSVLKCANCEEVILLSGDNQVSGILWTMGRTNVRQASALVSQCDLLICPDSGLSHVAGALETPFLALFGPIHSDLRLRYMPSANVIQSDVKCGPCFTHGFHETFCPLGGPNAPCMWNITPDEVFEKAVAIMEKDERFEIPSIEIIEDKAKECIFCGDENPRQIFRKADCEYYQCINCRSIFLHNDQKYDVDRYNSRYIELGEKDKNDIEQLFNYDKEKIEEFSEVEKGNILELGVGNAYYLSLFEKEGWNVRGVEVSDAAIEQNKKDYDIDLWKLNILEDKVDKFESMQFDLIVVRDFLEHFKEQNVIWRKINSWLKEGGIVIFSSPSNEIIKQWNESKYINTPLAGQHKVFLSKLALEILAENNGLKPRIFEMMQNDKYYFVVSKNE